MKLPQPAQQQPLVEGDDPKPRPYCCCSMSYTAPKISSSKIVALCSMANFINAADRVIMPIAVVPMTDEYHWNMGVQGWILSAFAYGYISSQVIGGKAALRFGGRMTLGIAVTVWSLATFMTPILSQTVNLLIMSRILLGFAEGFCLPTIFHIFAQHVPVEERSRAFGYLVALGSVGQTVASVICPHLSWPMMFYVFGCIGLLWAFIWVLLFRDETPDIDPQLLYNPTLDTTNSVRWTSYISHRSLWAIYAAHFAMNWSNYIVLSWLPTYLQRHLGANSKDISFTALPYIMNSLVGVIAGHLADSLISKKHWTVLSVRRLMTSIGLIGPSLFLLCFSYVDSLALAVCFVSISLGLCGCNSSGHMSNHPDVAPNHAGITFAVSNTLATLPGLACGPVTALVVGSTGYWYPVFVMASAVNIGGALIYVSQSSASQIL
ncbi:sialin-like [Patiria miniata]|uniref:Major facilitator superfamily (MFS) profile domain-containing protein n=1 Tax=Patiria miniata TaxID=46514 RepID=A0A914AVY4_PATMI|nr:sialin-like [Patiria miniata]